MFSEDAVAGSVLAVGLQPGYVKWVFAWHLTYWGILVQVGVGVGSYVLVRCCRLAMEVISAAFLLFWILLLWCGSSFALDQHRCTCHHCCPLLSYCQCLSGGSCAHGWANTEKWCVRKLIFHFLLRWTSVFCLGSLDNGWFWHKQSGRNMACWGGKLVELLVSVVNHTCVSVKWLWNHSPNLVG